MLRSIGRAVLKPLRWGAAYLAGLAVGYWPDKEAVIKNLSIDRTFHPSIPSSERSARIHGWEKAVKYAYGWAKED